MSLRPATELAARAFDRYRSGAMLYLAIALLPVLVLAASTALSEALASAGGPISATAVEVTGLIVMAILSVFSSIALILALHDPTSYPTWQRAYAAAVPFFWPYVIASALMTLVVIGGLLLLVIPGIVFAIWLSLTYFTVIIDGKRSVAALSESKALMRGRLASVGRRLTLLAAVYIASALAIGILAASTVAHEAVQEVVVQALGMLVTPFGVAYLYELYLDLRAAQRESSIAEESPSH